MSLYTSLVANVLFPIHERLKKHTTIEVFREMEKNQWLSGPELAERQLLRLRSFLTKIGTTVPYYQNLFSSLKFDPEAVATIADLQALPLMGKPDIREHTNNMCAVGATGLQRFNTGGSSGEPLIFYLGNERVSHDVAAKRRATRWWDVDIGDPEIVVWGSPIELGSQDRVRALRDGIFRTQLLSAFEMSEENLAIFVKTIQTKKPSMLFGYPSALSVIADYAQSNGKPLDKLGVKVVFVTSERLYDYQREKIEKVFGCPVANGYGGRDAGFIAHECPHGRMHITSEDIVVEIVDDEGEVVNHGEAGEIVVTHMATSEFPFVRYKTGDVGVLDDQPCTCGRGLPVLKDIQGRTTDFLVAQDGTLLHGLSLIYVLRDMDAVQSFKIVQESLDLVRVLLICSDKDDQSIDETITEVFQKRLGAEVRVSVERVSEIPAESSGKYRYVVSKLQR